MENAVEGLKLAFAVLFKVNWDINPFPVISIILPLLEESEPTVYDIVFLIIPFGIMSLLIDTILSPILLIPVFISLKDSFIDESLKSEL